MDFSHEEHLIAILARLLEAFAQGDFLRRLFGDVLLVIGQEGMIVDANGTDRQATGTIAK